jgi:GTP-binding protein
MSHKIFSRECKFIAGATTEALIPDHIFPEIGFIGRSNVGKSSLINSITNRNHLARTSNTPGSTKQLNFFNLDDKLVIVDMPGYGYAKASKKDVSAWQHLMRIFLLGRVNLKRIFVLIDSRHGLKDTDIEYMRLLDNSAVPYQIILTKVDLSNKEDLDLIRKKIELNFLNHAALLHKLILCSSRKKYGITDIQEEIIDIVGISDD